MSASVRVEIGPAPGSSALAWLVAARQTLATARARADLGVPLDVLDGFERYLDLWAVEMTGEVFCWAGDIDPALLRHLAAHWARLVNLARDDSNGSGLAPADPEGEAFFSALALGMADALTRADDAERFAAKFEEVVPDFEELRPRARALATSTVTRVLLVDDNPDIRLLVRIGLESSGGFEVVGEACDGAEAVDAVRSTCPDVVLLDLAMPVLDGFQALPLLKAVCPTARVVVFSANDSHAARDRVEQAGAAAFLRKDAAIAEVAAALRPPDADPDR